MDVPTSTVSGWIAQPITRRPSGDPREDLRRIAQRALALAESEMSALERHGRRAIDLDRLAKLTRILRELKTLQITAPSKMTREDGAKQSEALRLEDLGSELSEAQKESDPFAPLSEAVAVSDLEAG